MRETLDVEADGWARASALGHGYDVSHTHGCECFLSTFLMFPSTEHVLIVAHYQPDSPVQQHLFSEAYLKGPVVFGMWIGQVVDQFLLLETPIHTHTRTTTLTSHHRSSNVTRPLPPRAARPPRAPCGPRPAGRPPSPCTR